MTATPLEVGWTSAIALALIFNLLVLGATIADVLLLRVSHRNGLYRLTAINNVVSVAGWVLVLLPLLVLGIMTMLTPPPVVPSVSALTVVASVVFIGIAIIALVVGAAKFYLRWRIVIYQEREP